jgi:hypothetical protein
VICHICAAAADRRAPAAEHCTSTGGPGAACDCAHRTDRYRPGAAHPGAVLVQHPTALEAALALVEINQRDRYGPENSVEPWYLAPGGPTDHIYPTCPGLRRSLREGEQPRQGLGALYPDAGDVCAWCCRVWRARRSKENTDGR